MNSADSINIIEIFRSVQGETSLSGLPTTFIRLAACNLRCTWCDTSYSFGRGNPTPMSQIIDQIEEFGCGYVCVTGGEPLLQKNVHSLMTALSDKEYKVSLETGGSLTIVDVDPRVKIILDIKCPGSGMHHKNEWNNLSLLKTQDEIKFVLLDRADYEWAINICHEYRLFESKFHVLFSPVHGKLNSRMLVEWILEDKINVRLNLQIHKFIWDPLTRSV